MALARWGEIQKWCGVMPVAAIAVVAIITVIAVIASLRASTGVALSGSGQALQPSGGLGFGCSTGKGDRTLILSFRVLLWSWELWNVMNDGWFSANAMQGWTQWNSATFDFWTCGFMDQRLRPWTCWKRSPSSMQQRHRQETKQNALAMCFVTWKQKLLEPQKPQCCIVLHSFDIDLVDDQIDNHISPIFFCRSWRPCPRSSPLPSRPLRRSWEAAAVWTRRRENSCGRPTATLAAKRRYGEMVGCGTAGEGMHREMVYDMLWWVMVVLCDDMIYIYITYRMRYGLQCGACRIRFASGASEISLRQRPSDFVTRSCSHWMECHGAGMVISYPWMGIPVLVWMDDHQFSHILYHPFISHIHINIYTHDVLCNYNSNCNYTSCTYDYIYIYVDIDISHHIPFAEVPRTMEDVAFLSQLRADQGPPASTREGLNTAGATDLDMHIWIHLIGLTHTHTHTHIHTYIHTYIYIYTYIHTYIHTYTHIFIDGWMDR